MIKSGYRFFCFRFTNSRNYSPHFNRPFRTYRDRLGSGTATTANASNLTRTSSSNSNTVPIQINNPIHPMVLSMAPPDHFMARAHLVETKIAPNNLCNGTAWDHLSKDVWNKFVSAQQTEETYKMKMYLWRLIYNNIKVKSLSLITLSINVLM